MTIRKIINFKIPLPVAILIIILFIACWLWLTMPFDLLRDQRVVKTQRQLDRFSNILRRYAIKHETLPGPGLDDAIQSMMMDADFKVRLLESCDMIVKGIDPWKHHFIYEPNPKDREVVVRSCGPNGKDDGGLRDDIEVKIYLYGLDISPENSILAPGKARGLKR